MLDAMAKQQITLEALTEIMKERGFLIQSWPSGFMVISAEDVFVHRKDPQACWMWAFVNKEKKRYDLRFDTFEQLRDALFDCPELCHGAYPSQAIPNPWYQVPDERIFLLRDIANPLGV